MTNKTLALFSLCIALATIGVNAQEVLSTSGTSFSGDGIQMSFTIGEIATQTYSQASVNLTQGFNQPSIEIETSYEKHELDNSITTFPNPTNSYVNLKIENPQGLKYILVDLNGKILLKKPIFDETTIINLSTLPSSFYILKIVDKEEVLKSFNLIKK